MAPTSLDRKRRVRHGPSVVTDETLSCLRCGACCFNDNPTAVRVTGDDLDRLGEVDGTALTNWVGHRLFMRVVQGRCAALEVRADGTFACAVYERRPQVCRDLAQGSAACNAERWEKVHRTVVALARVRSGA